MLHNLGGIPIDITATELIKEPNTDDVLIKNSVVLLSHNTLSSFLDTFQSALSFKSSPYHSVS